MLHRNTSGLLIALEGIDGSGTTTQAERLVAWMRSAGHAVHATREPSTGPVGVELRAILGGAHAPMDRGAVALLFAADRLDHLAREIEPALAAGAHVVTDRYVMSSLAYQSVDLDRDLVASWNARARPADLTLLLDVPATTGAARRRARGGSDEIFDGLAFQEAVVANYRSEVARLRAAGGRVVVIDGTASVDEVAAAVRAEVESCLAATRAAS
jgi:dTMP kinase